MSFTTTTVRQVVVQVHREAVYLVSLSAPCRCPRRGALDYPSCHKLITIYAPGVRVAFSDHGTWGRGWSVARCALIA